MRRYQLGVEMNLLTGFHLLLFEFSLLSSLSQESLNDNIIKQLKNN